MSAVSRVILNLLLPPGIAACLLIAIISAIAREVPDRRVAGAVLVYAYLFAAVPGIGHAIVMERFYRRCFPPRPKGSIVRSAISGLAAGAAVSVMFGAVDFKLLGVYSALGAISGALTAFVISRFSFDSLGGSPATTRASLMQGARSSPKN